MNRVWVQEAIQEMIQAIQETIEANRVAIEEGERDDAGGS